jgi:asparagine synthase (glutamine-hydrolysing)
VQVEPLAFEPRTASEDPRYVRLRDRAVSPTLAALVDAEERASLRADRLAGLLLVQTRAVVDATPYAGIVRVPLGVRARLDGQGRFESEEDDRELSPLPTTPELPAALRRELRASVARAMEGARSVGVMAGGGVDSSIVLTLALEEARARGDVEVFAVAIDCGGVGDDRPHLRALAAHHGIEPVRVSPQECAQYLRPGLVADAAPCTWPSVAYEHALMSVARARGADRILSGVGGDDLFNGDPGSYAALARRGHLVRAVREAAALELVWPVSPFDKVRNYVVAPLVAPFAPSALRRRRRRRRLDEWCPWAGPVLRDLMDREALAPRESLATPRDRYRFFATSAPLAEVAAARVQREALTGVPRRDPLLDPALVEFVCRIEPIELLRGGTLRGLFRDAMRGSLPERVLYRIDKWGPELAQREIVRAAGGFEALRDLATATHAADLGLVDPAKFEKTFGAFPEQALTASWLDIWPVLSVEAFLRYVASGPHPRAGPVPGVARKR